MVKSFKNSKQFRSLRSSSEEKHKTVSCFISEDDLYNDRKRLEIFKTFYHNFCQRICLLKYFDTVFLRAICNIFQDILIVFR